MKLTPDVLKQLLAAVARTEPEEIGCDACFERMGRFAEMHLAGKSAAEAMPLVEAHLQRCPDCQEEFEAFLKALEAVSENGQR